MMPAIGPDLPLTWPAIAWTSSRAPAPPRAATNLLASCGMK